MEPKARTYEEAAAEFAAALTNEDVRTLHLHIDYCYHHFEYGLYLRNHYLYLLDPHKLDSMLPFCQEWLGERIYYLALPIIFPEFKDYERDIRELTTRPFDDLNANYYLKYGKNYLADIKPLELFFLPDNRIIYARQIAEHIWEYDKFKQTANNLGYSDNEIEETHQLCQTMLKEEYFFVPLEILFAKNASKASVSAMRKNHKLLEWMLREHSEKRKLLPPYCSKVRGLPRSWY